MDTTLLLYLENETTGLMEYKQVDLYEDFPITITIQQSDLNILNGRKTSFSKIVELPDTSNNSVVFEHYFEVNGVDFNSLNKIPCVVQYRGTDIFSGVLRLNSVTQTENTKIWEVYILGEVADFTSQLRDYTLQDISFTELNHSLTYDNIVQSWYAEAGTTNGLFDGNVLYPLINYGLVYSGESSGATPLFTYDFDTPTSFSNSTKPAPPNTFKPSIKLKYVLDKMFALTDYTITSEFFDTDYFNSIYMDTFQNGKIGVLTASAVTNQNKFLVQMSQQEYNYKGNRQIPLPFFDFIPGSYDPLNNWDNPSSTFQAPYPGQYGFNLRFGYKQMDLVMIQGNFNIIVRKSTSLSNIDSGTIVYTSPTFSLPNSLVGGDWANLFINLNLSAGEYIKLYIQENNQRLAIGFTNEGNKGRYLIVPFDDGGIDDKPFIRFDLYESPTLTGQELVDFKLGITNINAFDLFKSMITMFNLVAYQDEATKNVRIEPWNWFYNDEDRRVVDWTNILDISSPYKVSPLSFDLAKETNWTYLKGENEYLNKTFTDQNDFVYGRYKYVAEGNIFVGEQTYEVPFAALPTSGVTNAPNFIIPQVFYNNNQQQQPYSNKSHLFFWCGNRYAYKDSLKLDAGQWYMLSGVTSVAQTTYPCVSHLSTLDSQLSSVVSDLNFQSTFDFFGNSNTQISQFTQYDLVGTYWLDYILNIYSPQTRRFEGKFFLKPSDIQQIKLNDKIFVKDAFYSIEKIESADLVNKTLTQVSLLKDVFPYYKLTPPAPFQFLEPNTPYPGPSTPYYVLCFTSTDSDDVCNRTSSLQTLLTFGSPTISNGSELWYDTGTSMARLPIGTFVKQQTPLTSDTFVVVDTYGKVLQYNC